MNVPDTLMANVLRFIEASSVLGKRAMDKVAETAQAGAAAAPKIASVTDALIDRKIVPAEKKAEALKILGSHSGALDVLANTIIKLAEARQKLTVKQASMGSGEGPEDPNDPNKSLTSPFVGFRTSEKKASDIAFEKALGLPSA